jgi:hypothetical protein
VSVPPETPSRTSSSSSVSGLVASSAIYAATDAGLLVSRNGGGNWAPVRGLPPGTYTAVGFAIGAPDTLWAATDKTVGRLWKSTDDGATWIDKASEYLLQSRFSDAEEASMAARDFIEFCRGRAWVFTDVGTTWEGGSLYQFTHRTFLEYFSGAFMARIHESAESLGRYLLPRIKKQEWDLAAQLAFQIKSRNVEWAADRLLLLLLDRAGQERSRESGNALSFAARCLEFMVPSSATSGATAEACIDWCMQWLCGTDKLRLEPDSRLLADLLSCSTENRRSVWNSIESALLVEIAGEDPERAVAAAEVAVDLNIAMLTRSGRMGAAIQSLSDEIYRKTRGIMKGLGYTSFRLCIEGLRHGDWRVAECLKVWRMKAVFEPARLAAYPDVRNPPLAQQLVSWAAGGEAPEQVIAVRHIADLGASVSELALPIFGYPGGEVFMSLMPLPDLSLDQMTASVQSFETRQRFCFGLFVVVAGLDELAARNDLTFRVLAGESALGRHLNSLIEARRQGKSAENTKDLLAGLDLKPRNQATVVRWVSGETSFVAAQ